MPAATLPPLTEDEIDDLIYYTRSSDLPALISEVESLSEKHKCPQSIILEATIDEDSGCNLLHYAGANGDEGSLLLPSSWRPRAPSQTI